MDDLYLNYPWVPFFQELAGAILKFKDDRKPLLAWLRRDLSDLKNHGNKNLSFCERITDPTRNDIDPFSIFSILCKKYNYETLERIVPIYKDFFQIHADATSSNWGLITTNTTDFFFSNEKAIIDTLWDIFEKVLSSKNFEKEYNYIQEKLPNNYLSCCLSWICPHKYLGLNEKVIHFIRRFIVVNAKITYSNYIQILKQTNKLIEYKTISCNSLVQLTEMALSEHETGRIWFVPGSPQNFVDGKIVFGKSLLRELSTNYSILGEANPKKDTVILYGTDSDNNSTSIYLYMWGKFLPHKIKMRSEMLSHIEWHSYGDKTIPYKKDRSEKIFFEVATKELLDILEIGNEKTTNYMETNYQKRLKELTTLLETNKNLILTGAPGTGKTFMAKEIARALLLKNVNRYGDMVNVEPLKVQTENRITDQLSKKICKMVQFHPSYDYSDFVEGLRPTMKSDDQLGFKRVNGVFKDFCIKSFDFAIIKRKSDTKGSLMSNSLYHIYSEGYYEAVRNILGHDGPFAYFMNDYSTVFSVEETHIVSEDSDQAHAYSIKLEEIQLVDEINDSFQLFRYLMKMESPSSKDAISSDALNIFRIDCPSQEEIEKAINNHPVSIPNNDIDWDDKIKNYDITKVAKSYMALFAWVIYYAKSRYDVQYLPTVFIIDEINRGEVSKIFGELFFSIDPGYRGEYDEKGNDNKIQTQYQNLIPKEGDNNFDPQNADVFRHGFYVPNNVYIIGTMNDIDRSLESMDFAMHRRFAFEKVTAEESYQNIIAESNDFSEHEKKEIKERMTALNDAILEPDLGLGEAYQIGAAYFRKLLYYRESGIEQAFSKLWDYHLKGLLFEYLRGNQNSNGQLEALKEAYDNKVTKHEESNQDNR